MLGLNLTLIDEMRFYIFPCLIQNNFSLVLPFHSPKHGSELRNLLVVSPKWRFVCHWGVVAGFSPFDHLLPGESSVVRLLLSEAAS